MMDNRAKFALVVLLVVLVARKGYAMGNWTIARLEQSTTAKRLGIDNSIPPDMIPRAKGLVIIANRAESLGIRVNSAWRSLALTEAIYKEKSKKSIAAGGPPVEKPYTGPGDHGNAVGLDFDKVAGHDGDAILTDVDETLRNDPIIGPCIKYTLKEGDHLHAGFHAAKLVELGKSSANVA
jgi:hypothetical protein